MSHTVSESVSQCSESHSQSLSECVKRLLFWRDSCKGCRRRVQRRRPLSSARWLTWHDVPHTALAVLCRSSFICCYHLACLQREQADRSTAELKSLRVRLMAGLQMQQMVQSNQSMEMIVLGIGCSPPTGDGHAVVYMAAADPCRAHGTDMIHCCFRCSLFVRRRHDNSFHIK